MSKRGDTRQLEPELVNVILKYTISSTWVATGLEALEFNSDNTNCMLCRKKFAKDDEVFMIGITDIDYFNYCFCNDKCSE